jgi:hypothetical protein
MNEIVKLFKKLLRKILPGRFIEHRFTDVVSLQPVNLYEDVTGEKYLANDKSSMFRVYLDDMSWESQLETDRRYNGTN